MTTTLTRPETEYSQSQSGMAGGRNCEGCPRCQDAANAGFCKQIHKPEYGNLHPVCRCATVRPLCPPGPAQRRHIRPGAKWIPGGLNPDEPQLLCRTRKKKSRCGPSTNPRRIIQCFFRWQRLFAAPRRFFTPALRRKSSRPLIYIETNCLYL